MNTEERTVTIEVTQDCIDQATRAPYNCPVARAARNAGIRMAHVGSSLISGHDENGKPVIADIGPELHRTIRAFDKEEVVEPATFTATFRRNRGRA